VAPPGVEILRERTHGADGGRGQTTAGAKYGLPPKTVWWQSWLCGVAGRDHPCAKRVNEDS
jgi:hypothetical protein